MRTFVATLLLLALTPALYGQAQLVGKEAAEFKAGDMINEVIAKTLKDTRGEVVLIKYWGTR